MIPNPIKCEFYYLEDNKAMVTFEITNDLWVVIDGDIKEMKEIKSDFDSFTPIEQRAHLNVVLTEKLSQ